jgi:hypothetical protein
MRSNKATKNPIGSHNTGIPTVSRVRGVFHGISVEKSHHNATATLFQTLIFKDPESAKLRPR